MMFQCSAIFLICLAPVAARVSHSKWHGSHKADAHMRPEVVSQLLSTVEAKWTQEAIDVLSNHTAESDAFVAMETSCVKVSSAVVQGSDGDRLKVIDYMKTVCSEPNAKSNLEMCTEFAHAIQDFMVGDNVYNREQLDMHNFCNKFWTTYVAAAGKAAKKKLDEEEQKILAEEKKRDEDEAAQRKKLADEAFQKASQEAVEKRKLADAIARNHTSLNIATRWNAVQKKNQSAPVVANPSTNVSTPAVTTQNKTETLNTTTVQKNQTVQNFIAQKNQSLAVDTIQNKTQPVKNTTKLVVTNTTQSAQNMTEPNATATTMIQSKLTEKVMKHLRFVLNRTTNVTA